MSFSRRYGTRRGTSRGSSFSAAVRYLYALGNFSTANNFATQSGGGETGVASGFGADALIRWPAIPSGNQVIFHHLDAGAASGWYLQLLSGALRATVINAAGGTIGSSTYTFTATDVGRIMHVALVFTDSAIRLMVNSLQVGADIAVSGYLTPNAAPTGFGTWTTQPFSGQLLSCRTFRGTPSVAQMTAAALAARSAGDLPVSMVGATVSHRWSVSDALRGKGALTGDAGPASIADTITQATVDVMGKSGSPTVVRIDPSTDGRTSYGVQGASSANLLQTAINAGVQGSSSGFRLRIRVRWDALPSGNQILVHTLNSTGTTGWFVRANSTSLTFQQANVSSVYTITAADVGRVMTIDAVYTGTAYRLYVNGVQVGSDVTGSFTTTTTTAMQVGSWAGGPWVLSSGAIMEIGGGNYVPTSGVVASDYAAAEAAGVIQANPSDQHLWVVTQDVVASGDLTRVPAVIKDRIGTDDLTRVDGQLTVSGRRGLRLSASSTMQTAAGGGIVGTSTQLTVSFLGTFSSLVAAGYLVSHWASNLGWYLLRYGTAGTPGSLAVALNAVQFSGFYALSSGDLGTVKHVAFTWDGTTLRTYVDGAAQGSTTSATAYTPASSAPMTAGIRGDFNAATVAANDCGFFGISGGAYVATAAEIATQAAASITAGKLVAIPGRTDDRRYNFDPAASSSNPLPGKLADEMGSTSDPLVRVGSGLTLAVRTERLFSYETTPVEYGIDAWTDADYFSGVGAIEQGTGAGWWHCLPIVIESQSVTSATRVLYGNYTVSPNRGYFVQTIGTNTSLSWVMANGAGTAATGPAITIAASDVGKVILIFVVWDGTKMHTYARNVESGTGSVVAGYTPALASDPAFLGRYYASGFSASGVRVLGPGMGGVGVPSLAEIQSVGNAFIATDDLQPIPDKTDFYVSLSKNARANGGALPSTLTDSIGGKTMTQTGNPQLVPMYARAAGW